MVTTQQVGRDLHIAVEGIDAPYVVHPLPGRAGVQITETFLGSAGGLGSAVDFAAALMMAVDGATYDADAERWVPLPTEQQINYTRLGMELRQSEAESVLMPAFFWQSILGDTALNMYLEAGEGLTGSLKATGALAGRLRLLTQRPSPHTASEILTRTASSRTGTTSRQGGTKPAKKRRKKP